MPDVLEMPYRPDDRRRRSPARTRTPTGSGGLTCLAGDVIGDYSFAEPLELGERLVFGDMAHYTMVKNNTFNGVNLPSIALWDSRTDALRMVRRFGYEDFRSRLVL